MDDVASTAPGGSLSELRARHLELIGAWKPDMEAEQLAELAPRAEALRHDACEMGAWLDDPDDRDRAQGIIDYWTAALMGIGDRLPEALRLGASDAAVANEAAERAEAIVAPLQDTAGEDDAKAIMLTLVRSGRDGSIVCRPPAQRGDLVPPGISEAAQASRAKLLDRLVSAGIIRRLPDRTGDEDCYEIAYGSIARAWPRLRRWLDDQKSSLDTRERLKATAQLWKQSGDRGYLLAGEALSEAGRYIGEDPLLSEFIRVSRNAADRRRRQWLAASICLLIGVVGATFIAFNLGTYLGFGAGYDKAVIKQEEIVQSETPMPEASPGRDVQGRGIAGWVWAGNPVQPLLLNAENRRPVDPSSLVVDQRYRLGNDLWLRASLPSADGVAGERVSIVPRGGLVIVREAPQPVQRPSGTQYWVRVGVVHRVYLHHVNATPAQVDRLQRALTAGGFEVAPAERTAKARNLRDVRYFRPETEELASWLATRLGANLSIADGSPAEIRCMRSKSGLSSINLEIWMDFEGLQVEQSPSTEPVRCE